MSIASWKKEFYPITAVEAAKGDWITAVKHSIRKWEGMLERNLKKHNLRFESLSDHRGVTSCALCRKIDDCRQCPLFKSTGRKCADPHSPWVFSRDKKDPKPMIKALRGTLKMLKKAASTL